MFCCAESSLCKQHTIPVPQCAESHLQTTNLILRTNSQPRYLLDVYFVVGKKSELINGFCMDKNIDSSQYRVSVDRYGPFFAIKCGNRIRNSLKVALALERCTKIPS